MILNTSVPAKLSTVMFMSYFRGVYRAKSTARVFMARKTTVANTLLMQVQKGVVLAWARQAGADIRILAYLPPSTE